LDQYDANIAKLAANVAHGRDRAAGPPREGAALCQGIIICGKCGTRMTVRYHHRPGADWPTYLCQRDGIQNSRPICTAIPGAGLDHAIGQLLIGTLTPLAVEAALTATAELEHRAAEADMLRAAHVDRARYHADLARRRYPGGRPLTCAPTATRTRDLLLRRQSRNAARRRPAWPDVPFSHSDHGRVWLDKALCLWSLAPRLAPRDLISNANIRIPIPVAATGSRARPPTSPG